MREQQFRAELAASGFECTPFSIEPHRARDDHTHPWHARLLVTEGELTLATAKGEHVYRPGDTCAVDAHIVHAEITGASGARGLLGKKAP